MKLFANKVAKFLNRALGKSEYQNLFKWKVQLADLKNRTNSNIMNKNESLEKEGQSQILPPKEWIEAALLELLPKKLPFVQNDTPDTV